MTAILRKIPIGKVLVRIGDEFFNTRPRVFLADEKFMISVKKMIDSAKTPLHFESIYKFLENQAGRIGNETWQAAFQTAQAAQELTEMKPGGAHSGQSTFLKPELQKTQQEFLNLNQSCIDCSGEGTILVEGEIKTCPSCRGGETSPDYW